MEGTKSPEVTQFVVDASVGFKWFLPEGSEPLVREAQGLMDELFQGKMIVHVPQLFFYEIHNIFLFSQTRIAHQALAQGIRELHALPLKVHSPDASSGLNALDLAGRFRISIYDATYLVLARELNTICFTADIKLFRKARESGLVKVIA
ncbi:MAG: type II toxin-antitoxin system VapC family toxin [Proteobacteria bacterium]|nr:type II toxin-antitoxin system VapC family toxin [Pseudomonadota bacterium]